MSAWLFENFPKYQGVFDTSFYWHKLFFTQGIIDPSCYWPKLLMTKLLLTTMLLISCFDLEAHFGRKFAKTIWNTGHCKVSRYWPMSAVYYLQLTGWHSVTMSLIFENFRLIKQCNTFYHDSENHDIYRGFFRVVMGLVSYNITVIQKPYNVTIFVTEENTSVKRLHSLFLIIFQPVFYHCTIIWLICLLHDLKISKCCG